MKFSNRDVNVWKEALASYESRVESMDKPNLVSLDNFYCKQLPPIIHQRNPNPHITTADLSKLMQWSLTRGEWSPGSADIVPSLDEDTVISVSQKAFKSLPDVSQAISELTVLRGVEPATASAVLAAYAPDVAPFMSDEAMVAALGSSKDLSLENYLVYVDRLQAKAKELSSKGDLFTASDVERALWSCAKFAASPKNLNSDDVSSSKNKRKHQKAVMDDITRIKWTSDSLKCFLETCIEEVKRIGPRGGSLQKASWANLGKRLDEMHKMKLTQKQLKNQFDYLKQRYSGWIYLRNKAGNLYDPESNTFKLSPQQWKNFCMGHPKAKTLRSSPLPFHDLCAALFDATFATASNALILSSSRVKSGVSSSSSTSHIHALEPKDDNEDDDVDTSTKDSQSSSLSPSEEDLNVDNATEILLNMAEPTPTATATATDVGPRTKKSKESSDLITLVEDMSAALKSIVASLPENMMDACVDKLEKLGLDELDPLFCAAFNLFGHSTLLRETWLKLPPNPQLMKKWIGGNAKRLGFLE